jgi:hypothetical protein
MDSSRIRSFFIIVFLANLGAAQTGSIRLSCALAPVQFAAIASKDISIRINLYKQLKISI